MHNMQVQIKILSKITVKLIKLKFNNYWSIIIFNYIPEVLFMIPVIKIVQVNAQYVTLDQNIVRYNEIDEIKI